MWGALQKCYMDTSITSPYINSTSTTGSKDAFGKFLGLKDRPPTVISTAFGSSPSYSPPFAHCIGTTLGSHVTGKPIWKCEPRNLETPGGTHLQATLGGGNRVVCIHHNCAAHHLVIVCKYTSWISSQTGRQPVIKSTLVDCIH